MQIRDLERPLLPRLRAKSEDPLRKTAKELGVFLDKLTTAVRNAADEEDSVDDSIREKNKNAAFRRFKMHSSLADEDEALSVNLDTEQEKALALLQEARSLAADAGHRGFSINERIESQERLNDIFRELGTSQIATHLSLASDAVDADGNPLFLLDTPDTSHKAYGDIEKLIVQIYELDGDGSNFEHETALDAAERLREFLINEGSANAFSRFHEINRSNVLGLLK